MRTPVRLSSIPKSPLNGLSFASAYAGCGGLDIGFRLAGFQPLWSNEIDPVAVETYRRVLGDHIVAGDIESVPWPEPGSVDVVTGGPPCQGFSVAGKMNPGDPRSRHVDRFFDLVAHVEPNAFVMENVKALAISERWAHVRERLISRGRELGYDTSLLVLSAADFGVPQRRERMFLLGLRDARAPHEIPPSVLVPTTVREALSWLPPFGADGNNTVCTAKVTPARRPVLRPSPFHGSLLFNGNGRHLRLDAPAPTLPASMGGNATPIVDQQELDTGAEPWVVRYHRSLMKNGPVCARAPRSLRRITVEEAAQLSTFPLGMSFAGTTSAKFRQIGNAVPPVLARAVADAVSAALSSRSRSVEDAQAA